MLVTTRPPAIRPVPAQPPGLAGRGVLAHWPGRGPLRTPRGLAPLEVSGPERYVQGPGGPGLLVERASTNLVSNPRGGGEGTSPWVTDGAGLSPQAIQDPTAPHGTALRLAGHSGNIARIYEPLESQAPSLAQGTPYSVRFHARALNAEAIDTPLQALLWETGGASPGAFTASVTSTFTAEWVEHQFTGTIKEAGRTGSQFLAGATYTQAVPGAEYGLTDIHVEMGPESTTYLDGSLGDGHAWSGASHESPSSRVGTVVSARTEPLGQLHCTVAVALTPQWSSTSIVERTVLAHQSLRLWYDGAGAWRLSEGAAEAVLPADHASGDTILLVAGLEARSLVLASGVAEARVTRVAGPSPGGEWALGSMGDGSGQVDAVFRSVRWLSGWPDAQRRAAMLRP